MMDYTGGRITLQRVDGLHVEVKMGMRQLGHINLAKKTFTCKRYKGNCTGIEHCKFCKHRCHFFRIYEAYAFNEELINILMKNGVEKIIILLDDYSKGYMEKKILVLDNLNLDDGIVKEKKFERQILFKEDKFTILK